MATFNCVLENQPKASGIPTQPSHSIRVESNLLADEKDPRHLLFIDVLFYTQKKKFLYMLYFFNRKLGLLLFFDGLYLNKTLFSTFSKIVIEGKIL